MCDRSHLALEARARLKELRTRAKRLGYRLYQKRGFYELWDSEGARVGSQELRGIAFLLDLHEGKFKLQYTTACGRPLQFDS